MRWVLVLSVALLSYGLAAVVIYFMVMGCGAIMASADNVSYSRASHFYIIVQWISKLSIAWVSPMAFVMLGAFTAPKGRLFVCFGLIMIHAVIYAFAIGMCVMDYRKEDDLNQIILVGVVGTISTIFAGVYLSKTEPKETA